MMDEDRFWAIIAESRERAARQAPADGGVLIRLQAEELERILTGLAPEEIVAFQQRFDSCRDLAYRWDVWGAAYWMFGGCGNDNFLDFRSCLISLGKETFRQVLADPDCLVELADRPDVPYLLFEGFQYVAPAVYREKTGEPLPGPQETRPWPSSPRGSRFDFEDEDEMRRRFPRLVAKFPEMGD